jgi:hypothetical protein
MAAAVSAAVGFITPELLVANLYGRSHFLTALADEANGLAKKANLIPVFFSQLGGVMPAVALLGLVATGVSGRRVLAAGGAMLAVYAAVAFFDARFVGTVRPSPRLFGVVESAPWKFQLAEVLFDVVAAAGVATVTVAARRLAAEPAGPGRSDTRFLLAWLGIEAAGYLVLTPFPAVRRVLGVFVVLTIIFGRLATRTCVTPSRRRLVNGVVAFGIVLGLAYLAIDWLGARAYRRGAEEAAAFVQVNGGGRVFYVGRWGFRYYAERVGMVPVVPRYDAPPSYVDMPPPSNLRRGDWLVVTEESDEKRLLDLAAVPREAVGRIVIEDSLPVRTVPCFYGGRTPLEHHEGPRLMVDIYRITSDFQIGLLSAADSRP